MSEEQTPARAHVAGLEWTKAEHGEWRAVVDGRFIAAVWPFLFGRNECVVRIRYPASRDLQSDRIIRIDFPGREDRDAAMTQAAAWIRRYQATPPMQPDALIRECIARDPHQYTSDADVVEQAVFRGADGGFSWLDGAIVPTNLQWGGIDFAPDPAWTARRTTRKPHASTVAAIDNTGNLFLVPDDVRPEWLAFVFAIAQSFRNRGLLPPDIQGEARTIHMRNQELGILAHRELLARFPTLRSLK
ncbi:hypothetical protein HYV74_01710 [Candidatus Uhrbacteria bacterium]|nr:hypothetical protein [Candidatus Uhrbacteria bacterium]